MTTALVLVAHGTSDPQGRQATVALRAQVARLLPGVRVLDAYVDVQQPRLSDVVDSLVREGVRTAIVPVLLSTGYHMEVDVTRAAEASELVTASPPLGPHPVLAEILRDRLEEAGAGADAPVVLAAAGSSRPEAAESVRDMAAQLRRLRSGRVVAGFAAAQTPSVSDAVRDAGAGGADVWIASYLMGRGFFHTMLGRSGVTVTEPLGADPRIARLIRERFLAHAGTPAGQGEHARPASVA